VRQLGNTRQTLGLAGAVSSVYREKTVDNGFKSLFYPPCLMQKELP